MINNNPVKLREIVYFAIVGVIATVTHYCIALVSIDYLGLNLYAANLTGYVIAVLVSYFGHGKLSFQVTLNRYVFRRFIIVSIVTFCLSELFLLLLEIGFSLPHQISLLLVVLTIPVISFILNKFIVFKG